MKWKLSWHWFEAGLLILCLALNLYIALSPSSSLLNWYNSDDAFYYFKVAANVTSGHDLTFDGINRTNGFHPLWMVICLSIFWLARFDLILPLRVLVIVSALMSAGSGILLFRLLRKYLSTETAAASAVFWVFLPSIYGIVVQNGMEACISAFFLILLFSLVTQWRGKRISPLRLFMLGLVAGLAILARLDNIFVVALLGVWFVFGTSSKYLGTVVVGDLAIIFISGLLSYYFRLHPGVEYASNSASLPWLIGIGFVVKPAMFFLFGMYKVPFEKASLKILGRNILAISLASLMVGGALIILQRLQIFLALPRLVIVIDWIATLIGIIGLRILYLKKQLVNLDQEQAVQLYTPSFWKEIFSRAVGYYFPLAALLGGYMVWNLLYVGTAMPVSGQIKHWWSTVNNPYGTANTSFAELLGFLKSNPAWELASLPVSFIQSSSIFIKVIVALLIVLFVAVIVSQRKWIAGLLDHMGLLVLFSGLYAQIFSYTATGYIHIRSWYWVGEILFTTICLGILLESTHRKLKELNIKAWVWHTLTGVIGLSVLISFGRILWQNFSTTTPQNEQHDYLIQVSALEEETEPGALIGMTGGGTTAYFLQGRTVVNLDGLVNSPQYFDLLKVGEGSILLDQMGLDYVLANPDIQTGSDLYRELLDGHLDPMKKIGDYELYRYIPAGHVIP